MPPKKKPAAAPKSSPLLRGRSPIRGVKIGRPASKANSGLEKKLPFSSQADLLRQQGGQVGTGPCHICTAWNCQKIISGWHLGQV